MGFPIQQNEFLSFDGTRLAYQTMGTGKKPIILCNGLGGTVITWRPMFDAFGDKYRFICWDYRGLFRSDPPKNHKALTIADHARDLEYLLKKLKIKKSLICGWSMGVQVALELYRIQPKVFQALLLMNGTAGFPFDTALNNPLSKFILPKVNELAKKILPKVQAHFKPLASKVVNWEGLVDIISALGLVHENIDREIIREVAKDMLDCDLGLYHEIMEHLSQHDSSDILAKIKVPTLVMAGTEDVITPFKLAEKMAETITNAELSIIPRGSHYTLLEFPDQVILRFKKFLAEHY